MKRTLLFILTVFMASICLAKTTNPVDRYKHEYKNHQDATCPIENNEIKHFVYFAIDRQSIKSHPFLKAEDFSGAQIMYPWVKLEVQKGVYDFSAIEEDLLYLKQHGKELFIQLQDSTFLPGNKGVPSYLFGSEYADGVAPKFTDSGKLEGWVAKRWHPEVQERFSKLILALGKQFDGRVEGINLQETAIDMSEKTAPSFTPEKYVDAIKDNMSALKKAFPQSTKMQYANFMPGEWMPWEDEGYLRSIYQYGEEIGVGLGAPDLLMRRRGQLNHPLAMMHENSYSVPLGIAVQDGNYIGKTNNMDVKSERRNLVPVLHSFADEFLDVDYMFWANQKPYFRDDVIPCFEG